MAKNKTDRKKVIKLTIAGILTAVVIVFQFIGASVKLGTFSVSLVLIPIVIGAALGGKLTSTWLGFVFGAVVLLSGDAALFMEIDPVGTFITVLLKGTLAGFFGGLVFDLLQKKSTYLAVVLSAIVTPCVNTGVFLLGCRFFFFESVKEMGANKGFGNPYVFLIVGFVGINFLLELAVNIILSPAVVGVVKKLSKNKI